MNSVIIGMIFDHKKCNFDKVFCESVSDVVLLTGRELRDLSSRVNMLFKLRILSTYGQFDKNRLPKNITQIKKYFYSINTRVFTYSIRSIL